MIAHGAIINLVTRCLAVAAGLVIVLIAARMGPHIQGALALFTAVESITIAFFSGFGIALARRISHHQESSAGLIAGVTLACLGAGTLAGIVIFVMSKISDSYSSLWILACGAPFMLIANNLTGVYLGQGRMTPIAVITLGAPTLTLMLISACWLRSSEITLAIILWSWVLARSAVGIFSFLTQREALSIRAVNDNGNVLKQMLPFVAAIGLTNMIGLMNYKVDLFLVEHYLGLSVTGGYSIAVMVGELLWFVSSAVTQAAYARIGTPEKQEASRLVVRVMHFSLLALSVMSPILWFVAWIILPRLLGTEYSAALPILAILLPGIVAFGAASSLSAYFTNHFGRPIISAILAGLSLLINVIVSVVLIPRWGAIGGAVATSVSYLVSVIVSLSLFARMSELPWRDIFGWQSIRLNIQLMWPPLGMMRKP